MSSSKRVHLRAPEDLIEIADVIAKAEDKSRTDIVLEALREYLDEASNQDAVKQKIADAYYGDELSFEEVKEVLGLEDAQNLRVLKDQLKNDSIDEELLSSMK